MARAAHLYVLEGGELAPGAPSYGELTELLDRKQRDINGLQLKNGALERELANVRGEEPAAPEIREVLEFWREVCGHPGALIGPDTSRWAKTRARLRQGTTVEKLQATIVGAAKDDWCQGKPGRDDIDQIFKNEQWVDRLAREAGQTGRVRRSGPVDASPLEAACHTIRREFGFDAVAELDEREGTGKIWTLCPLHPEPFHQTLLLGEKQFRGSLTAACAAGCEDDDVLAALRGLYGIQAARPYDDEVAHLRVRVAELEHGLTMYAAESWWEKGRAAKDRGATARAYLGEAA
jgi:hypothetical protein